MHAWLRILLGAISLLLVQQAACAAPAPVILLTLDGAVSPATADYVVRGIRKAADQGAGLVLLQIDTPGGLDTSMRRIVKEILAAPLPVVAYVAPGGARAASAGTFILYASHVAAMAPATNLGAATPVPIGASPQREPDLVPASPAPDKDVAPARPAPDKDGAPARTARHKDGKQGPAAASGKAPPRDSMSRKQVHDAAAYIRSLAQLRGRNADWGEQAVREAVSLSAEEARKLKVIDVVALDVNDLLRQLQGRKIMVQGVERALDTAGASPATIDPDWRSRLLAVITDPSIALILMMIGIYGLIFEFANPGFVLPGVAGAICLLLALFAFQLLPVNYAGLGLIALGLAFVIAEAFLPSFGALGIGGTAALVIGAVMLFDPETAAGYAVPLPFIITLALVSAALVFAIVALAMRARRRPVVSGREDIIGAEGVMLGDAQSQGWAHVRGETWRVVTMEPLSLGARIRVIGIDGLTLSVLPLADEAREARADGGAGAIHS